MTVAHAGEGVFPTWAAGTRVENLAPCGRYCGWLRGSVGGKVTYFPQSILENGRLRCAYNPTELAVAAGSRVRLLALVGAWAWVQCGTKRGWLPADKLESAVFPDFVP